MGSSKANLWERAFKLQTSAMKMVVDGGSRSVMDLYNHCQRYLGSYHLMDISNNLHDPWRDLMLVLRTCVKKASFSQKDLQTWVDHLQIFVFGQFRKALVNYYDPAHHRIDCDQYAFVAEDLCPEHFPVRGKGQREVIYDYLEFDHEPTTQEVLSAIEARSDIRVPDFAETRDYHKTYPQERMVAPVISLCGTIETWDRKRSVACVEAYDNKDKGLRLNRYWLGFRWLQCTRFLVVRK